MSFSKLELPHTVAGEVDWDTLGKMLCAHLLGEVLCASYVDKKYGIAQPGLTPDTEWKFLYHEDNVVALQKTFQDSPINAFMGRGVIDLPMDVIIQYLESHEHRKEWDRYLVEIKPIKTFSYTDSILYMRCVATNCLVRQERDFVHFERMTHVGDKYVRSAMAVNLPECPPKPGVIRAELKPGTGWVLEPYRGCTTQTLVSYLAHLDLKALPPLLMNRLIRRQPKAIYRIRKILTSNEGRLRSLSMEPRDHAPWSEDSLTSIETRQVLDATTEYYHDHNKQFSDDITIDEFTGKARDYHRTHSTISVNLNPHSDTGKAEESVVVKDVVSGNHSPSPKTKKKGSNRGSFKFGRGSTKEKKKKSSAVTESNGHGVDYYNRMHSSPTLGDSGARFLVGNGFPRDAVAMHAMCGDTSAVASSGTGLLWQTVPATLNLASSSKFLELSIDGDPHIKEDTGLEVDNPEVFYTPQESDEDCKGAVDSGNEGSRFDTPHESESGDEVSRVESESNHTEFGQNRDQDSAGPPVNGSEEKCERNSIMNQMDGKRGVFNDEAHGLLDGDNRSGNCIAVASQSDMLTHEGEQQDSPERNCANHVDTLRNGLHEVQNEEIEQPSGICPSDVLQNLNIVKDDDFVQEDGRAGSLSDDEGSDDLFLSLPTLISSSKPLTTFPKQQVQRSSSEELLST